MSDTLKIQGRMTLGYGIIPKLVMQDKRLTIEAKAIYAYFCSYAGAGSTAFPSRNKITYDLQMGIKRYYNHFNLLKDYGYIEVEQKNDTNGKFKSNIYTLVEMIDTSKPCSQNDHTEPCSRFAYTDEAYTDNDHTKSIKSKNNIINNNKSSQVNVKQNSKKEENGQMTLTNDNEIDTTINNHKENKSHPPLLVPNANRTICQQHTVPNIDDIRNTNLNKTNVNKNESNQVNINQKTENQKTTIDNDLLPQKHIKKETLHIATYESKQIKKAPIYIHNYITTEEKVKSNIDYDSLIQSHPHESTTIDELINVVMDVLLTESDTIKINGEIKNRDMVRSVYLNLNYWDIEHILDRYKEQHHKITYINRYLKTMLYIVKQEQSHYLDNAIRVDGLL